MSPESDEKPTKITIRPSRQGDTGHVFRLVVEQNGELRSAFGSREDRVLIGRSQQADLVIDHESVSRIHCEVTWEEGGFVLRDLGSKAGTCMGSLRVREVFLANEARIGVGDAEVSFSVIAGAAQLEPCPPSRFGGLLGASSAMRAVHARLALVAARDTTVLLEGESGTGKELVAQAIHDASARRAHPFIVVDCGSIPRTLLEAELFGHERGAYTGASRARVGAFVLAEGGTLFLDEVGELDIDLQPRLLGALERREVKPIGAEQPIPVNARIIAATNRDLRREANRGAFREDLYYRLAVACVRLPPLRERMSDIPLLVKHFLEQHSRHDGVDYPLEDAVLKRLMQRPWPGNVRELRNVVEQLVAFGIEQVPVVETPERPLSIDTDFKSAKAQLVENFERDYLVSVLAQHGGNISAAANAADLDRVHFLRLLDRHGLRQPRVRPP